MKTDAQRRAVRAETQRRYCQRHPERAREIERRTRLKNKVKIAAAKKIYYSKNVAYFKKYHAEYKAANPEKMILYRLRHHLKKTFGITLAEYEAMLASQHGLCALCHNVCKSGNRLCVDHCHKTGKIRALLCNSCNLAIGFIGDDVDLAKAIVKYLEITP